MSEGSHNKRWSCVECGCDNPDELEYCGCCGLSRELSELAKLNQRLERDVGR